jgi:Glycosyltransferase family 87
MTRPTRTALLAAGAGAALLLVSLSIWLGISRLQVGRSDFTSIYVGATLLRDGHGAQLYDEAAQDAVHAPLLAPGDHEGNLPYLNPPSAALAALPLTALSLPDAYRVWSLLQLVLVALGVAAAVRAAPWPHATPRHVRLATWTVATAGLGAANTLFLGQWDGLLTLGLGLAYLAWRRDRALTAGVLLGATALLAKPHLFLGLAAFLLLRRDRRALAGAAAAAVALAAVSLALVGPQGVAGFVRITAADADRWPPSMLLGFSGLFGSALGGTATAHLLAAAADLAAVGACAVLGARSRDPRNFETALAGAVALSLAAAPHLLAHDLVLLAPAAAFMLAGAARRDGVAGWPGPHSRRVLALWLLVNLAPLAGAAVPPGVLVPLVLAGLGVAALRLTRAPRPVAALAGT